MKLMKLRERKFIASDDTDENVSIFTYDKVRDEGLNLNLFVD